MIETAYKLAPKWGIGEIQRVTPVGSGTSCETFMVKAASGKYILRGFPSQLQAEQEAVISRLLSGTGIGAAVLQTPQGISYVPWDGLYYNLQTCLSGVRPDFADEQQLTAAAEATAKMHRALASYSGPFSDHDRFATVQLLLQIKGIPLPPGLFPDSVATLEAKVEYISGLEKQLSGDQMIHGDLGEWNMLWNGATVHIIDFGECRRGDRHFDLAALICGMLSKCSGPESYSHNMSRLLGAYERIAGPVDLRKRNIGVYLWLLRGALASALHIQEPTKRDKMCQYFADELMRFKHYTGIRDLEDLR